MSNQDSWSSRIAEFAKVIGKTPEEVEAALARKPYELTKDTPYVLDMLSDSEVVKFGDFVSMFEGVSFPKLRMAVKFLAGPKEERNKTEQVVDTDLLALQTKFGIKARMEDLNIEQLLPFYNPTRKSPIHDVLIRKYQNKYGAFIAFKPDDNVVAVEETINYVTDLESGYTAEKQVDVDGELVTLCKVGELPNTTVEEDPLWPCHPLKRGRSTGNRINWNGIDMERRQLFRVLYERGEVPADRIGLNAIIAMNLGTLKSTFPEAYAEFKQMKKDGELPKLTMKLGQFNSFITNTNNDPFGVRKTGNRTY